MEEIHLNIVPTGTEEVCHVKQNDNKRSVKAHLLNGKTAYAIRTGDVVLLNIKKPDNSAVSVTVESEVGNTFVILTINENMCNVVGKNFCELRITNEIMNVGTSNFYMEVGANPIDIPPTPTRKGGLTAEESEIISTTYETL